MRKKVHPDDALRALVLPIIEEWLDRLGLRGTWELSYSFVEKFDQEGVAANVTFQGPYKTAFIEFARKPLQECCTSRDREYMIVHELVHIQLRELTGPLERAVSPNIIEALNPFIESVTDLVTIAIMRGKYPQDSGAHYHDHR